MTPYYQDDHVTIYHGDCESVLPTRYCKMAAKRMGQEVLAF